MWNSRMLRHYCKLPNEYLYSLVIYFVHHLSPHLNRVKIQYYWLVLSECSGHYTKLRRDIFHWTSGSSVAGFGSYPAYINSPIYSLTNGMSERGRRFTASLCEQRNEPGVHCGCITPIFIRISLYSHLVTILFLSKKSPGRLYPASKCYMGRK